MWSFTEVQEDQAKSYYERDWRGRAKIAGLPSYAEVAIVVSTHDLAKANVTLYKSFCDKVWWTVRTVDAAWINSVNDIWYPGRAIFQNENPEYITFENVGLLQSSRLPDQGVDRMF